MQPSNRRSGTTGKQICGAIVSTCVMLGALTPVCLAAMNNQVHNCQSRASFIAWCKEHAVQLNSLDPAKFDYSKLSFLDKELAGKRIIYLGEPDHYIQEKYDYRLLLIRYLVEHGWKYIGAEMGRSDGQRVNEYIQTGDDSWLAKVALYGYRGAANTKRDQAKGRFASKNSPSHIAVYENWLANEKWFARQLRSMSLPAGKSAEHLYFFGFDVDVIPGTAYEDIQQLLEKYKSQTIVAEILDKLAKQESENIKQEIMRLGSLCTLIEGQASNLKALIGSNNYFQLCGSLQCLKDSLQFMEVLYNNPANHDLSKAYAIREHTMYCQMDELLHKLGPNEKVILMGHNMHLSKDSSQISFGKLGKPDPPMWTSIGSYLNEHYKNQVYSIWLLYDHGLHAVPNNKSAVAEFKVKSKRDCLENLFAQVGHKFVLPLTNLDDQRCELIKKPLQFNQNGDYGSGNIAAQADCIFFIDEVNAPGKR